MPEFKIETDETGPFAKVDQASFFGPGCYAVIRPVTREDGRKSVVVSNYGRSWFTGKLSAYTLQKFSGGEARFMHDDGSWTFLPHDYESAVAALFRA